MTDALLTTTEAARKLGVGPTSVKRWADAGLLRCVRTAGKHRRFQAAEVERFQKAQATDPRQTDAAAPWVHLLTGDAAPHAVDSALLSRRAAVGSWWAAADELGSVIDRIGQAWSAGELSLLDEHMATERLIRALARCAANMPTPPNAPRCLLATAVDDDHTVGLSLAEVCLREAGWTPRWAGRVTPTNAIVAEVASGRLDMVAMSASGASADPHALAVQAEQLSAVCVRNGTVLVLGGRGAWPLDVVGARRAQTFSAFRRLLTSLR